MHAFTKDPELITSEADIVVTDVGVPNMVRGHWLKQGAFVIDMGTTLVKVRTHFYASFEIYKSIVGMTMGRIYYFYPHIHKKIGYPYPYPTQIPYSNL